MGEIKKINLIIVMIGVALVAVSIYAITSKGKFKNTRTIRDIAYGVSPKLGYTVYIEESNTYVPYLVLARNYNGHVLLLRKYLLDEPMVFNPNIESAGHYKDSLMDQFLSIEFIQVFNQQMQEQIAETEITITDIESLNTYGTGTMEIRRKIFLLSIIELGIDPDTVPNQEGNPLKYFKDGESRIAYYSKDHEAGGWWTRTSYTVFDNAVWVMGYNSMVRSSMVGSAGVYYKSGVRPAFCVDPSLLIIEKDDIIEGQKVFVLSLKEGGYGKENITDL